MTPEVEHAVRFAAETIAAASVTQRSLRELLRCEGVPHDSEAVGENGSIAHVQTKLCAVFRVALYEAFVEATESDQRHLEAVRRFFLDPHTRYSVAQLAALWRVTEDDVRDILADELPVLTDSQRDAPAISWADAYDAVCLFNIFPVGLLERALGDDFERVRPASWRTVPIVLHLPAILLDTVLADNLAPTTRDVAVKIERLLLEVFRKQLAPQDQRRNPRASGIEKTGV